MAEKDDEEHWEGMLLPVLSAECSPSCTSNFPCFLRENVLVLENATTATFCHILNILLHSGVRGCRSYFLSSYCIREKIGTCNPTIACWFCQKTPVFEIGR